MKTRQLVEQRKLLRIPYLVLKVPYSLINGMISGIKYHVAGQIYTPKPLWLNFMVTRRCNAKCIMCSIWKTGNSNGELTIDEIREIFSNRLFDSLTNVTISGGECILREDMVQVVKTILNSNKKIRDVGLNTNGLESSLIKKRISEILSLPECRRLKNFHVLISIDGYGATHQKIRGIPHAFKRVNTTIQILKRLQGNLPFRIILQCVVQQLNVKNLPMLSEFAQKLELPINFVPVAISGDHVLNNLNSKKILTIDNYHKELKKFFHKQSNHYIRKMDIAFWEDYFRIAQGARRSIPCALLYHSVFLDSDGTLFMCSRDKSLIYGNVRKTSVDRIWYSDKTNKIRKQAKKYFCPTCSKSCNIFLSLNFEFFYYAKFLLKNLL